MHYYIYCNQKNISKNHLLAIEEFQKRLSAYCETTLYPTTSLSFPKDRNPNNNHFVYVQSTPSTHSSEEFSEYIKTLQNSGVSNIHILIGYSKDAFYSFVAHITNYNIPTYISLTNSALSAETKTLLFFEQLYRGYTILQGKTYHK